MQTTSLSIQQEKWLLVATITASSLAFIDFSAINVALPAIQRAFELKGKALLWIVNSYSLFLSALMLLGGSLGDYVGRKKIFIIGIVTFSASSLICGISPNSFILIGGRALQGIGGALMVPGSLSMISALIPKNRRGRAYGTWSTFSALTTIIGPILGGWLAGAGLWRFIFFINIPLAIAVIFILTLKVPESRNNSTQKIDWIGGGLATFGLAGLTYGFIEASDKGWGQPAIMLSLIAGLVFLVIFLIQEYQTKEPMMPLHLFKNSTFSGANLLTLLVYGALSTTLFFLPLNLIQVQGYSEFQAGLAILPFALIISILSRLIGSLVDRLGNRLFLIGGPLLTGTGFFVLSLTGLTDNPIQYWNEFFLPIIMIGAGMGVTVAPLTTSVMTAVSENYSGIASGINNAIARTAGVLAIAILGTIALTDFDMRMERKYREMDLSQAQLRAVKQEIPKLAEANPPDELSSGQQNMLQKMIHQSFVGTFQLVTFVSAIICWIGGVLSWFLVKN